MAKVMSKWKKKNSTNISLYQISSSSCHAASTDIPDPLPSPVSIVHRSR